MSATLVSIGFTLCHESLARFKTAPPLRIRNKRGSLGGLLNVTGQVNLPSPIIEGSRECPPPSEFLKQFRVQDAEIRILRWHPQRAAGRQSEVQPM